MAALLSFLLTSTVYLQSPGGDTVLAGTVLDESGGPLEGVVVVVTPRGSLGREPLPSATSDPEGRFQITVPKKGPYAVDAYLAGFAPFRSRSVETDKALRLVLRSAKETIRGVVRDGETLAPIEGALVRTRVQRLRGRLPAHPRWGVVETVTDAEGLFELADLSTGRFEITASAPAYGQASKEVAMGEPLEIYLFPGAGIYGRLTDPNDKPVEGAYVSTRGSSLAERTDTDGRFALLGLEPGAYRVFARHPDFAPAVAKASLAVDHDAELTLQFSLGTQLTGRVVNEENEPIDAQVLLQALDGGSVGRFLQDRFSARTDAEGSFHLKAVPGGEHSLRVRASGYAAENVEVYLEDGDGTATEDLGDLVLEIGLAIHGRVVDENEQPVPGARVFGFNASGGILSSLNHGDLEVPSDDEGRFVLAGLSDGAYRLTAVAPGFGRSSLGMAEAGATDVTLVLQPAGSIRGAVVDADDRIVSTYSVTARSNPRGGGGGDRVSSEDGVFLLEDVAQGEYVVEVSAHDFISEVVSDVRVSAGNVTDLGTIQLRPGAHIEGTVVDTTGASIAGATVLARTSGLRFFNPNERSVTTDRSGHFAIRGLADGNVSLVANHPSYAQSVLDGVEIDSRKRANDVEMVMSMGGALDGVVRTRDARDALGRTIRVSPDDRSQRRPMDNAVQTDEAGSFRFEHLPEGLVQVSLLSPDVPMARVIQSRPVEIVEGQVSFVEFDSRRVLVQGQLSKGGMPLATAEVELWAEEGRGGRSFGEMGRHGPPPSGPRYLMAMTSADGFYELFVDQPGNYRVQARANGVGLPSKTVTVPDVDTFQLDLDFGATAVSGRVIDGQSEEPVMGAFVSARPVAPSPLSAGAFAHVGTDGNFAFELDPGEYQLIARAEGYATKVVALKLTEAGRNDVVVSLAKGELITGRIYDQRGHLPGSLRVYAAEDTPDPSIPATRASFTVSLPDGSFTLEQLSHTRYNVLAGSELAGFAFEAGVRPGKEDLEMLLRPGGYVEVLVRDRDGEPLTDAPVSLAAVDGRKIRGASGMTDAAGRSSFAVPAGNLHIKSGRSGEVEGMARVFVPPGGRVPVEIIVEPVVSQR